MAAPVVNNDVELPCTFGEESNVSLTSKVTNDSENLSNTCFQMDLQIPPVACLPELSQEESDEIMAPSGRSLASESLCEYQWPVGDKNADWYMLQEQVSEYLDVKSFKRKYPDLYRRPLEVAERNHLQEKGVVTETQCDLGLTAVKSHEVVDLLIKDYPQKYEEYAKVLQEKERQDINKRHKEYTAATIDKGKMAVYIRKAVRSAAEYNSFLMKERREERKSYYDLQTGIIQCPKHMLRTLSGEETRVSLYPVALIPGQFAEHYKRYSPDDLKYLPLKTAVYSLPKVMNNIYADPGTCGDTDESSSESESSDDSSSCSEPSDGRDDSLAGNNGFGGSGKKEASFGGESRRSGPQPAGDTCRLCGLTSAAMAAAATRDSRPVESCIQCSQCDKVGHPSCFGLTTEMFGIVTTYEWLCMDCKICTKCNDPGDEEKMMFCDRCDRGYHTFCVGLKNIPTGNWECPLCTKAKPNVKRQRK